MSKKIFSVNVYLPGDGDEYIGFKTDRSLMDADIVVFSPQMISFFNSSQTHEGKPLLSSTDSFHFTENLSHWRTELDLALNEGKTIFFFLTRLEIFYTQSERDFTVIESIKRAVDNYSVLPVSIGNITSRSGKEIRVARDLGPFANYWNNFSSYSEYQICLDKSPGTTYLTTKTGNKAVGVMIPVGSGHLVLLPRLKINTEGLLIYNEESDEEYWNEEGLKIGRQLLSAFVEIDKALRDKSDITLAPEWADDAEYKLAGEAKIEASITEINLDIDKLTTERNRLYSELLREAQIRKLLYEKGHALEEAITEALTLMGFRAERFQDSDTEFDIVFISPEGRFIGEAEGKDSKAINIDKLSQLERELQEDFARDEIAEYAKGVLFGNAYRLVPIAERSDFFTNKCISGAKRSGIALVRTIDLFPIAKYLKYNQNDEYATACRKVLAETKGTIVVFPNLPE